MKEESKPKVTIVLGTRPEAIKLCPVILAFKACNQIKTKVVLTGQHREMVYQVMNLFGIHSDLDLNLMSQCQTLTHITCASLEGLGKEFSEDKPNLVLVQGDTTTAFAAALAAFYQKIPVGHVEAGLRTDNLFDPFPEEGNRRLISQIASLHFAPTIKSFETLQSSNISGKIEMTGNTVIDALLLMSNRLPDSQDERVDGSNYKIILTTVHRRENWGSRIENVAKGILLLLETNKEIAFLLPMHPNPIVRKPLKELLGNNPRIELTEPLDYDQLVSAMKRSYLILTDSGGLQEEAPSLGKPVLVLRETTERPEAVEAGTAKLIGTQSKNIYNEVNFLLHNDQAYSAMAKSVNPFGDGYSSDRIIGICKTFLGL